MLPTKKMYKNKGGTILYSIDDDIYKIITLGSNNIHTYILSIYDIMADDEHKINILTSSSLLKLLSLHKMPKDIIMHIFDKILLLDGRFARNLIELSTLFSENIVYHHFDPYINFLLDSKSNRVAKTKSIISKLLDNDNTSVHNTIDFADKVNPYGFEKVVFSGGGMKGALYLGCILGLLLSGQIFYLNYFIGASVGSMTAIMLACATPSSTEYNIIKNLSLNEITESHPKIVARYKLAIGFIINTINEINLSLFFEKPTQTFYGMMSSLNTILKNNGLYDHTRSGFKVWISLICKKICQIMENGMDKLIIVKRKDGTIINFPSEIYQDNYEDYNTTNGSCEKIWNENNNDIKFTTDDFKELKLVNFFTFQEYFNETGKTILLSGTKTSHLETVHYTHTHEAYKFLSVMDAFVASSSIPWIFKAPIINGTYNLDGGIYDNYPITHCDKKIGNKITHYNNKIFGFLIDDNSSIIDAYEIIKELWLIYNEFNNIMCISYLITTPQYTEITELFFEIRNYIYKLLYFTDASIYDFLENKEKNISINIQSLSKIYKILLEDEIYQDYKFKLPVFGIQYIHDNLKNLTEFISQNTSFKTGTKTTFTDVIQLATNQGLIYNDIISIITHDINILNTINDKNNILCEYMQILLHIVNEILVYYEHKGSFVTTNHLEYISKEYATVIKNLHKLISSIEKNIENAMGTLTKPTKNYLSTGILIAHSMINKIYMRSNDIGIDMSEIETSLKKSMFRKSIDYFFQTDMTGILLKYMCIANDRVCDDTFNQMRTVRLNSFETGSFQFDMCNTVKTRLFYEGFTKTIKFFVSRLRIFEIICENTNIEEYIETNETIYKRELKKN